MTKQYFNDQSLSKVFANCTKAPLGDARVKHVLIGHRRLLKVSVLGGTVDSHARTEAEVPQT